MEPYSVSQEGRSHKLDGISGIRNCGSQRVAGPYKKHLQPRLTLLICRCNLIPWVLVVLLGESRIPYLQCPVVLFIDAHMVACLCQWPCNNNLRPCSLCRAQRRAVHGGSTTDAGPELWQSRSSYRASSTWPSSLSFSWVLDVHPSSQAKLGHMRQYAAANVGGGLSLAPHRCVLSCAAAGC